jgi:ribosomal protein S18 acetylase RimI-like enzyme
MGLVQRGDDVPSRDPYLLAHVPERASLALRPLVPDDLSVVEPWFDEAETQRWLGGREWPRQLLHLVSQSGGRYAYAAVLDEVVVVGLVDVERYDDSRAAVAVAVAPEHRRRGIGAAMLRALAAQPELASVIELFGRRRG